MQLEFSNSVYLATATAIPANSVFPFLGYDHLHSNNPIQPKLTPNQTDAGLIWNFAITFGIDQPSNEIYTKYKSCPNGVLILKKANYDTYYNVPIALEQDVLLQINMQQDKGGYRVSVQGVLTSDPFI